MTGDIVRVDPYWYSEKNCLGRGSFGEVYKGHQNKERDKLLAIKRIRKGKLPQQIVDKEIQILQELSRPEMKNVNFVTLMDCVQTEQHVYLVMEYCNGGDLDHYLEAKGKFDESSLKVFLQQIASAYKILYDNVILHRDLKPANILLSLDGSRDVTNITFKIADFGLGRFLGEGDQARTFCGTPAYMAPEVSVPNAKYDYKADLFSIGAIVYQCFTGTLFSDVVTKARKLPSQASAELQDLITRLLCKEPSNRINFADFYNHPFIGMKDVERKKMMAVATPSAPQGPTVKRADVAHNPAQKHVPQHIPVVNLRSPISPAAKGVAQNPAQKNVPQHIPVVIIKSPILPAAKDVAHGPAQKHVPHRIPVVNPRSPISPAAKGGKIPVREDAVYAKETGPPSPSPRRKGLGHT